MPQHNPLVTEAYMPAGASSAGSISTPGDLAVGLGPIHLTIVGFVLAAVAGLILLRKVGFRFSVVAGGR